MVEFLLVLVEDASVDVDLIRIATPHEGCIAVLYIILDVLDILDVVHLLFRVQAADPLHPTAYQGQSAQQHTEHAQDLQPAVLRVVQLDQVIVRVHLQLLLVSSAYKFHCIGQGVDLRVVVDDGLRKRLGQIPDDGKTLIHRECDIGFVLHIASDLFLEVK